MDLRRLLLPALTCAAIHAAAQAPTPRITPNTLRVEIPERSDIVTVSDGVVTLQEKSGFHYAFFSIPYGRMLGGFDYKYGGGGKKHSAMPMRTARPSLPRSTRKRWNSAMAWPSFPRTASCGGSLTRPARPCTKKRSTWDGRSRSPSTAAGPGAPPRTPTSTRKGNFPRSSAPEAPSSTDSQSSATATTASPPSIRNTFRERNLTAYTTCRSSPAGSPWRNSTAARRPSSTPEEKSKCSPENSRASSGPTASSYGSRWTRKRMSATTTPLTQWRTSTEKSFMSSTARRAECSRERASGRRMGLRRVLLQ